MEVHLQQGEHLMKKMTEVNTWMTVALGQKWDVENLCRIVEAEGIIISSYAKGMMQEPDFVMALDINPDQKFDLVAVFVEHIIGLGRGAKTTHVIEASIEMGFHLCPHWMVFMLGKHGVKDRLIMGGELLQGRLFGISPKGIYGDLPIWLAAQDRLVLVKPHQTNDAVEKPSVVQSKQESLVHRLLTRKGCK